MDFVLRFSFVGLYEKEKVFDITHHGIAGISESAIDHTREIFRETRLYSGQQRGRYREKTSDKGGN
jgi:hypothetical protein